ncbi:anti-sigma factor RsbA family regulatory protein [Actinocorallia longicatena]|uniref:Sensor histidine kinase n=1 Tax=Actinocorallia longicatena TaxID=111803 RepID=A0ABP6QCD5_9ACTN
MTETKKDRRPDAGFQHPLMLGSGDGTFADLALAFLAEGLARGERVAAAVPETRLGTLAEAFGPRLRLFDLTEIGRNPGRILPLVLFAFADAAEGDDVRILQEPVWEGRTELEYPACVQHEALTNLAFAGRRMTVGCFYDASALGPAVVADAHATHQGPGYSPEAVMDRYDLPLPEPERVHAVLRFDAAGQEGTRAVAAQCAAAHDLGADQSIDVELVVNELTANSVAHGGGSGLLRIWGEKDALVCEVTDAGRFADPLAGRRPAGLSVTGGRGLLLVHCLSDLVRTHTTENSLTIRAYFRR